MQDTPLQFPQIDPIIFSIGPFDLGAFALGPFDFRWYGLMYLCGLAFAYWFGNRRARLRDDWTQDEFSDLLFWGFIGLIVGGRVGYVLFYQFSRFLSDPLYLFDTGGGGMSFHGGLLGVLVVFWWFARRSGKTFLQIGDFIAPLVPIGLGLGRVGNFINGELWGRVSDVPWAMVFPYAGALPRHPSQLYQAALEGLLLFILLAWFSAKPRPRGAVGGLFLVGYGCARFVVEFFRQPDGHLGLLSLGMSMGQWLSLPMIVGGVLLMVWAYKQPVQQGAKS